MHWQSLLWWCSPPDGSSLPLSVRRRSFGIALKRENARRSPTGRSHFTDTLSPVHQHHDCASPTCLQHPTCRWSHRLERIWIHHIFCLQNPGSCEQGRAVDKWLGSSDQWSEDPGHSFLPFHLQRKSRHKAWRQDTAPSGDSHLSRGKAWHPTLMETTHRGHGEKRHQEACCPEEIVWNTLGCQLQDSKNRLHGSCPAFSGIWGQRLGDSCQDAHQQTGQSSEYRLEDNPWRHENHSYSWNGEDRWSWTTRGQETGQTSYPCRKDEEDARPPPAPKAQRPHKKQIEKEKSEPPSKRTAEGTRRHPYNRWTPVWKTDFKQLATRNPTCWDQNNHSWHHYKGKPKWSSFEGSGSGRDGQALSSSNLDTHLHRWLSWKRHKKRRLWCLHQAPRQASIICVSTWWDTVLKLQSWSPSTAECHRKHHWEEKPKKAVFLTDSLSALQALMSDEPDTTQKKLTENINTLAQTTYVVLQWIPAHTGIRGNEMADQLAKEGREKEQPPSHLSYREVKTLIHNKKKAIFHCKTEGYNPNQDALHQLARHQQTIIFRLRTGHCRLNSHLKRIGVKTSAQCPCGEANQTPEHYLQSCSFHQQARQQIWPTCVSLKTKLWWSAEDLLLTSRYAALTGERI